MPNAQHPYTDRLTFAGRVLPLKRPMAEYAARRLQAILPQIAALNAARMSKEAAAKVVACHAAGLSLRHHRLDARALDDHGVAIKKRIAGEDARTGQCHCHHSVSVTFLSSRGRSGSRPTDTATRSISR